MAFSPQQGLWREELHPGPLWRSILLLARSHGASHPLQLGHPHLQVRDRRGMGSVPPQCAAHKVARKLHQTVGVGRKKSPAESVPVKGMSFLSQAGHSQKKKPRSGGGKKVWPGRGGGALCEGPPQEGRTGETPLRWLGGEEGCRRERKGGSSARDGSGLLPSSLHCLGAGPEQKAQGLTRLTFSSGSAFPNCSRGT